MRRRAGWMFADAMTALALLSIAVGILFVSVNRQHVASEKLNNLRAASRLAESALIALQTGQPLPAGSLHVQSISTPDSQGGQWIEVTAAIGKETSSLVGRVPRAAGGAGGGS